MGLCVIRDIQPSMHSQNDATETAESWMWGYLREQLTGNSWKFEEDLIDRIYFRTGKNALKWRLLDSFK